MKKNISKMMTVLLTMGIGTSLAVLATPMHKASSELENEVNQEIEFINEDELYPNEDINFHHWKFEKMYDDLINFDYDDPKNKDELGFLPVDPRTMTDKERENFLSKEFIEVSKVGLPLIYNWQEYFEMPPFLAPAGPTDADKNILSFEDLSDLARDKEEAHLAVYKALRSLDELYTSFKYLVHTRAFAYELLTGKRGEYDHLLHGDNEIGTYWKDGEYLGDIYPNYANFMEVLFNLRNRHGDINITISGSNWGLAIGGYRNPGGVEQFFDRDLTMTDVNKLYDYEPIIDTHRTFGWNSSLLGQQDTSANYADMWAHETMHWSNPVDNATSASGVAGWAMDEVQHNFMPNDEFKDQDDIFWTYGSDFDNEYLKFALDATYLYDEDYISPVAMIKRGWIPLASRNSTYWMLEEYDKIDLEFGWFQIGNYSPYTDPMLNESNKTEVDETEKLYEESNKEQSKEGQWSPYRPCVCSSCLVY